MTRRLVPGLTSLCLLSYQRPHFLPRAVQSAIRGAEGCPLEVIVHDDGSTDPGLIQYLNNAVRGGDISTLILNPAGWNQGQGVAVNRMFGVAVGDVLIKADQDLEFKDGWLRAARDLLSANHRIGLLGLFKYELDPVDWRKTLIAQHDGWGEHTHLCGSLMAIPRFVYDMLGPLEEHSDSFSEDWVFQRAVTASEWCCALPDADLVINHGFGIGPSTVVIAENTVQTIHHGPMVHT